MLLRCQDTRFRRRVGGTRGCPCRATEATAMAQVVLKAGRGLVVW